MQNRTMHPKKVNRKHNNMSIEASPMKTMTKGHEERRPCGSHAASNFYLIARQNARLSCDISGNQKVKTG